MAYRDETGGWALGWVLFCHNLGSVICCVHLYKVVPPSYVAPKKKVLRKNFSKIWRIRISNDEFLVSLVIAFVPVVRYGGFLK